MADEKKFDIKIGTTADDSGLKKAEEGLQRQQEVQDELATASEESLEKEKQLAAERAKEAKAAEEEARRLHELEQQRLADLEATAKAERRAEYERRKSEAQNKTSKTIIGFGGHDEAMAKLKKAEEEVAAAAAEALEKERDLARQRAEEAKAAEDEAKRLHVLEQQRIKDVETAQKLVRRRAEEEALRSKGLNKEILTGTDSLAASAAGMAAIVGAAKLAGDAISETIGELEEMTAGSTKAKTNWDIFFDALKKTIDGISSPIATLKDKLKSLAGLDNLQESIDRADEMKSAYERMLAARKKLTEDASASALQTQLQNERNAISQIVVLEAQRARLNQAQRGLAAAQEDVANQRAVRSGASQVDVAADSEMSDLQRKLAELEDKQKVAEAELKQAEASMESAYANLNIAKQKYGIGSEQAKDASQAFDEARSSADNIGESLKSLKQEIDIQKETLQTQTIGKLDGLASDVGDSITDSVKGVVERLQQQATEQGGALSEQTQGVLSRLIEILGDGIPEEQQLKDIRDQMARFSSSTEARDQTLLEYFNRAVSVIEASYAKYAGIEFQDQRT